MLVVLKQPSNHSVCNFVRGQLKNPCRVLFGFLFFKSVEHLASAENRHFDGMRWKQRVKSQQSLKNQTQGFEPHMLYHSAATTRHPQSSQFSICTPPVLHKCFSRFCFPLFSPWNILFPAEEDALSIMELINADKNPSMHSYLLL